MLWDACIGTASPIEDPRKTDLFLDNWRSGLAQNNPPKGSASSGMSRVARSAKLCPFLLMIGWNKHVFFMLFKFTLWGGGLLALASIVVVFGTLVLHFHLILGLITAINLAVQFNITHLNFIILKQYYEPYSTDLEAFRITRSTRDCRLVELLSPSFPPTRVSPG